MANQFKKLRYPDNQMKPTYTIADLEKAGIGGHSAIHKYESGTSNPGYDALKAYKNFFKCSYEYLFEEVPLPAERHKYITDKSLLSKFNASSVDNLNELLNDSNYGAFNTYMLNAFLENKEELQNIMDIIFRFMYALNQIYTDSSLRQGEKELKASPYWSSLNQHMDIYLRDTLMSKLESGYQKHEAKNEKIDREEEERVQKLDDELQKQKDDIKITVTKIEPIPITNE